MGKKRFFYRKPVSVKEDTRSDFYEKPTETKEKETKRKEGVGTTQENKGGRRRSHLCPGHVAMWRKKEAIKDG